MNQCQGCQAGWKLQKGEFGNYHIVEGGYSGEIITCTKSDYEDSYTPEPVKSNNLPNKPNWST